MMPATVAPPPPVRYLTIEQTAARLGYSYQSVALFVAEGQLPAVDIALQPGKTRALLRIPENATVAPKKVLSRF